MKEVFQVSWANLKQFLHQVSLDKLWCGVDGCIVQLFTDPILLKNRKIFSSIKFSCLRQWTKVRSASLSTKNFHLNKTRLKYASKNLLVEFWCKIWVKKEIRLLWIERKRERGHWSSVRYCCHQNIFKQKEPEEFYLRELSDWNNASTGLLL